MTERERLEWLREMNCTLSRANDRLFMMLWHKELECIELREANANLRVERDAADAVLDLLAGQQ